MDLRDLSVRENEAGTTAALVRGVAAWFRKNGRAIGGFDARISSNVPSGTGLSSSAAIQCAVAVAASDLFGLGLADTDDGRRRLSALCRRGENVIALAPTGGMDQTASLRCLPGHALFLDCQDDSVAQVPFDLAAHRLVLLVIDTHASHGNSDGQYGARRADCERACRELGVPSLRALEMAGLDEALARLSSDRLRARVRHVVTEIERVRQTVAALGADDFEQVGRLFTASHVSLRDDYEVSCPELDVAVQAALTAGALGARMTGGGFGGSAIALIGAERVAAVEDGVTQGFVDAGFRAAPQFLEAVAAAPAGPVTTGW
jgi:galactokinase